MIPSASRTGVVVKAECSQFMEFFEAVKYAGKEILLESRGNESPLLSLVITTQSAV